MAQINLTKENLVEMITDSNKCLSLGYDSDDINELANLALELDEYNALEVYYHKGEVQLDLIGLYQAYLDSIDSLED